MLYSSSYYRYAESLNNHKILTRDEQRDLFKELNSNPTDQRKEEIVRCLLECNFKLVIHLAKKMYVQNSGVDIMDLISAGNQTLYNCIFRYNIDNDTKAEFSTYAGYCISSDMRKEFNQQDLIHIPRDHKIYRSRIARSILSEEDLPEMKRAFMDISNKIHYEAVESIDDCEFISREYDVLKDMYLSELGKILKSKMHYLSKKQIAVIESFYFSGKEKTMEEIAKEFNTSKQAVSILLKRTLERLKVLMRHFDIKELI